MRRKVKFFHIWLEKRVFDRIYRIYIVIYYSLFLTGFTGFTKVFINYQAYLVIPSTILAFNSVISEICG
jgi:hypothetical protein